MLIDVIRRNAERVLLSAVEQSDQRNKLRGALHFQCSKLELRPEEAALLLILRPLLEDKQAAIYFFQDGDLVITWSGVKKSMLDDLCKRLYAHFQLTGKEALDAYYDFTAHGEDLRSLCRRRIETLAQSGYATQADNGKEVILVPLPGAAPAQPPATKLEASPEQIALFRSAARHRKGRKYPEIMVVEDQAFSNKLLVRLLEQNSKVYPALNAKTGLELYCANAPDISFLDIEMPGASGHDLAAVISKMDADAYIVMVTANNYIEDVVRAKQNGAKGFVVKPFNKQKILERVDKYIQDRK